MRLPASGWRLLLDPDAEWRDDDIHLPGEFDLADLPVNPPTGGWSALADDAGVSVSLPTTVEEHHWGEQGLRDYRDEYYFELEDKTFKNGAYYGVSWFYRKTTLPEEFAGKRIYIRLRSARLRAEIYLNGTLVGYHLVGETSYECDATEAARPGEENLLAVRITNPGGRFDWLDTKLLAWGEKRFHTSHGFGGLDDGVEIVARDPVHFEDARAANLPRLDAIDARTTLINTGNREAEGTLRFEIFDPDRDDALLVGENQSFKLKPNERIERVQTLQLSDAIPWSPESPRLYRLRATATAAERDGEGRFRDERVVEFGFRHFDVEGVGENARLTLNGERTRVVSAISWGFWGYNGIFPRPELAEKETAAAKRFNMNAIQFHRNVAKTEPLVASDRLGVMRWMEPGGGVTALGEEFSLYADSPDSEIDDSGADGDPRSFAERYMEEKILRAIRDHRSHPSLVMYCVQNEINPDLRNPRVFRLMRRIHEEDPSRVAILKSGVPPTNQVWTRPYDDRVYYDDGTGFSGFFDQHTVGGPGVWRDEMYRAPDDLTHHSDNRREIVVWGEMLGAAVPDDHAEIVSRVNANDGKSYDKMEHETLLRAYDDFLDRRGFRDDYPETSRLFQEIGAKCYDFWGRVIETARLAEANDYLVISGWESTAIENHSGLLDNQRNFKADPELIAARLAKLRPVVKTDSLVYEIGERPSIDLFLLNETRDDHPTRARLTIVDPNGGEEDAGEFEIEPRERNRFVYPITRDLVPTEFTTAGEHILRFALVGGEDVVAEERVYCVDTNVAPAKPASIGVLSREDVFIAALDELPGVSAERYDASRAYDLVVATNKALYGNRGFIDPSTPIENTDAPELFTTESWGNDRNMAFRFTGLPSGETARVTLLFAEIASNEPNMRLFDAAINGEVVLKDFDVFGEAGGMNKAVERTFEIEVPASGEIVVHSPRQRVDNAKFSAIKVEAGEEIRAINCGSPNDYVDKDGVVWTSHREESNLDEALLRRVGEGTPLVVLAGGPGSTDGYARSLAEFGAIEYRGRVGGSRSSWMGSWYFTRRHEALEGLPRGAAGSYYQAPTTGADGVLLECEADVFIGFGRDHDPNVGAAGFIVKHGEGEIAFYALPGADETFARGTDGAHPVVRKRIIQNTLRRLLDAK